MKVNISNMPLDTIYRFDTNKYVMSTELKETRKDGIPLSEPKKYTEIYKFDNDGTLLRVVSGILVKSTDTDFTIKDDDGMLYSIKIAHQLQELPLEDLYELRNGIERNYQKENGTNNIK